MKGDVRIDENLYNKVRDYLADCDLNPT
jgi:hypothetical protein